MLNKSNTLTTLDLERVTQVVIEDKLVATLAGLEWATNLVTLVLDGTATTNLTALQNLRRLSYLEIEDNGIVDLTPLAGLSSLAGMSLEGNSISNLNFLQNLTGLIYLSLDENGISDLSPLSGLTNLDNLSANDNLIANLVPIQNLPRLTLVDLRWNLLNATNPVLQSLDNRDVEVKFLPQRGPPEFDSPKVWVMDSGATSRLYFNVDPNGFSGAVTLAAKSSNTNLLSNAKLLISDSGGGWWSLSMTGTSNLTGTSTVTLSATNDLGFSDRWDITVTVATPLTFDGQVVNPGFTWLTGANGPWSGQTAISYDGTSSATSGTIEDGEQSWLEATLQGPGVLSFWWRVSSETNEDWLEFYMDGVLKPPGISGEVDWQQRQVTIPSFGTHKARWQFTKDFRCCADGEDAAWVDQVIYVPLSWLEAGRPTNGQCPLTLHLAVGHYYEVQTSTNMFNWSRLAFLVPTNSTMPFLVSASSPDWRFYRLRDYAADSIRLDQPRRIGNQFRMDLLSPTGLRFEMQTSTNMVSWSALTILTNTLGSIPFTNTVPANAPPRFYRAKLLLP